MTPTPRTHQLEAIAAIQAHLHATDRVSVLMAVHDRLTRRWADGDGPDNPARYITSTIATLLAPLRAPNSARPSSRAARYVPEKRGFRLTRIPPHAMLALVSSLPPNGDAAL